MAFKSQTGNSTKIALCVFLSPRLYKKLAVELGFDEFHLFIRPVQFEFAVQRDRAEQRPVFITSLLQDSTSLDRLLHKIHYNC